MPPEPIQEVSEPEVMSTTESITSEHNPTLEDIFSELKRANTPREPTDEFTKLKKSVDNLPKIDENLGNTLQNKHKPDVVKINDPIVVKHKKTPEDDAGQLWFNMKQPEMTDDIKRDIAIIKQRSALDPKRHYKKDKWNTPKYFQMGTIVEGNTEFYNRLNKRQRGQNLVDEILHDSDSQKYFKRKYNEIQAQKTSGGKGHYKKVREMRKRY